eukprot:m.36446 g.36446  ORF g.36446 m.36446 type:complete len:65 (-) comp10003_c0_seq1:2205-2399(-)
MHELKLGWQALLAQFAVWVGDRKRRLTESIPGCALAFVCCVRIQDLHVSELDSLFEPNITFGCI